MIGEYFINSGLGYAISVEKNSRARFEYIMDSILFVLDSHKSDNAYLNNSKDYLEKCELLKYICEYRCKIDMYTKEILFCNISEGKYKVYLDFLEECSNNIQNIDNFEELVIKTRKLCYILSDKNDILSLINKIEIADFETIPELTNKWENTIENIYTKITEYKKFNNLDSSIELDLVNDSFEYVVEDIRRSINEKYTLKTGFSMLDDSLPAKGLENRRLYIIAGPSGTGKSILLNNILCNAIENNRNVTSDNNLYIYITAENLIGESLLRLYCCLMKVPVRNVLSELSKNKDFHIEMKKNIKEYCNKTGCDVKLLYVRARGVSVKDIDKYITSVSKNKTLKAVFFDYLDLARSGRQIDDLRIELGEIALGLKCIAIEHNIPFITATQLNRSGYNSEAAPSLVSMSESMKKVDPSDFILFIQPAKDDEVTIQTIDKNEVICKKFRMSVLKNRNGKSGYNWYCALPEKMNRISVFNFRLYEFKNDDYEDYDCDEWSFAKKNILDINLNMHLGEYNLLKKKNNEINNNYLDKQIW